MKHINLTNWRGSITDWTKLNYIYGGLDDSYAVKGNLRIDKDNYNYVELRESKNLCNISNQTTTEKQVLNFNGIKANNGNSYTLSLNASTIASDSRIYLILGSNATASNFSEIGEIQSSSVSLVVGTRKSITLTTNSNGYLYVYSVSRGNVIYNVMLNVGSTALPYEPYFEGKKYVITEKLGIVDLGSMTWLLSGAGDNARFISLGIGSLILKGTTNLLCSKYTAVSWDNLVNTNTDMIIASRSSDGYLGIRNLAYNDAPSFKTAMSGIMLTYPLATPVIEVVE